jgi:hypothetical protein
MAVIAYENVSSELQSQIREILADSSSNTYALTQNVMDGMPIDLIKGRGFPYVLVHSPVISEDRLTMSKFIMTANVRIEIISEQEQHARSVYDAVRQDLKEDTTIKANQGYWYRNATSSINYSRVELGGRMKGFWTITANIEYRCAD